MGIQRGRERQRVAERCIGLSKFIVCHVAHLRFGQSIPGEKKKVKERAP